MISYGRQSVDSKDIKSVGVLKVTSYSRTEITNLKIN